LDGTRTGVLEVAGVGLQLISGKVCFYMVMYSVLPYAGRGIALSGILEPVDLNSLSHGSAILPLHPLPTAC